MSTPLPSPPSRRGRVLRVLGAVLAVYLGAAYLLLPTFWRHYEHLPAMEAMPKTEQAPNGLPGDPLNVGLIGSEAEIQRAFAAAAWHPADPITLRSSLGIAASVVLDRPDPEAPVSNLMLFGRRQDLAFEKDLGDSARRRNHVRLWHTDLRSSDGREVWIGGATFDEGVGLSHTTGQITHHIAPDVDAERDTLMHDLAAAGQLTALYDVTGVGPTVNGHNGGGDRYYTDGELAMGVLATEATLGKQALRVLDNPTPVRIKDQLWSWLSPVLAGTADSSDSSGTDATPPVPETSAGR